MLPPLPIRTFPGTIRVADSIRQVISVERSVLVLYSATPIRRQATTANSMEFRSIGPANDKDPENSSDSWQEWYRMTPLQRWNESQKLWQFYLQVGGSLDPEPDYQSPFDPFLPRGSAPAYGRSGLRVLRRGRV